MVIQFLKGIRRCCLKSIKGQNTIFLEDFKINTIKVNLKQAEAALKVAKNLSFTQYKAPFTGTATNNKVDIGSEIKSGELLESL